MANNVVKIDFKRLRDHAKANRWSANGIARESGVTPAGVSGILSGKTNPRAVTLKAICDVISLPIEEVFITRRAA